MFSLESLKKCEEKSSSLRNLIKNFFMRFTEAKSKEDLIFSPKALLKSGMKQIHERMNELWKHLSGFEMDQLKMIRKFCVRVNFDRDLHTVMQEMELTQSEESMLCVEEFCKNEGGYCSFVPSSQEIYGFVFFVDRRLGFVSYEIASH